MAAKRVECTGRKPSKLDSPVASFLAVHVLLVKTGPGCPYGLGVLSAQGT